MTIRFENVEVERRVESRDQAVILIEGEAKDWPPDADAEATVHDGEQIIGQYINGYGGEWVLNPREGNDEAARD